MLLSEKITMVVIGMTIIFYIISGNNGLKLFIVLILIGVLILRELVDIFVPSDLKNRINFFIYVGIVIFAGIVVEKVIRILA